MTAKADGDDAPIPSDTPPKTTTLPATPHDEPAVVREKSAGEEDTTITTAAPSSVAGSSSSSPSSSASAPNSTPPTPEQQQQQPPPQRGGEGEEGEDEEEEELFTVFTKWQRRWISFATSFAAMFSTMSSYVYYPALLPISLDLGVSLLAVNLTMTSYLVVAGLAPSFMGDMADQGGRRPVYVLMFALMIGANLGIALQRSYPALLVLRMVQSAGSSGLYGAAYGVIADIATIGERGSFVGFLLVMTDVALTLGPVIGGAITERLGWRWIFWFLVILTGSHFVAILLFLPETQRKVVGNGSAKPHGIHRSLFASLVQSREVRKGAREMPKRERHFPNPLASLPVLAQKGSLSVIAVTAITYAVKNTLQASLGAQVVEIYRLDYLAAGLVYLPSGLGSGICSFLAGKWVDRNYRRKIEELERETGMPYDRSSPDLPLEQVRLEGIYALIALSVAGTVGYGVALSQRAHISVMLIMQFVTGGSTSASFALCGTLLTDLNVHRSATAQAASNLVRCLSGGAAIAAMQALVDSVGVGWCFAVYAGIFALEAPLVWTICRYGTAWRVAGREAVAAK